MNFLIPFLLALVGCIVLGVLLIFKRKQLHIEQESNKLEKTRFGKRTKDLQLEQSSILDALTEGFLIADSNFNITFANNTLLTLFEGREVMGRKIGEAILEEPIASHIIKGIEKGKQTNASALINYNAHSPFASHTTKGEARWAIDVAPIKTITNKKLFRIILRDESAQHQVEQVRKDFVANASHELRTPLAIIQGYIENLLEDDLMIEQPSMARKFLEIMQRHSSRISRIIEDMLVVSRLESGEAAALNKNVFNLEQCILDVVERLESVIRKQNASVDLQISNPELELEADRFYITQVLFNLIENALKQNANSEVNIQVRTSIENQNIIVEIEDNGVGIPSADLNHIFRRFYRVQKHHSQKEIKGTGLGLSIVKRAIEAHGGEISVSSTPGVATIFRIELPLQLSKATAEL